MYILIAQVLVSIILIVVIILQAKGGGLGAAFGGSTNYHAKRGMEKTLFYTTIFISILFIALSFTSAI